MDDSEEKTVIKCEEIYPNKYPYFKMVSFVFGIHGPQLDPFSFSSTFSAPSLALVSIANTHPLTGPSLNVRVGVRQLNMGERQKPIEALQ